MLWPPREDAESPLAPAMSSVVLGNGRVNKLCRSLWDIG